MIIGTLIDSIFLSVYGGNPSDDISLSRPQVQMWLQQTRDMLVKSHLDEKIKNGETIDSLYIIRESCVATELEDLTCVEDEDERIFFTISKRPMSLLKDMGVVKVVTDEDLIVYKTTIERSETIKDLKYAKPSITNLVYYRTGLDINVLGLNSKNITTSKFIVFYVPSIAAQTLAETDDIVLQDDLLPSLLAMVEDEARRELFGMQDDENDGTQPSQDRMANDWRLLQAQQGK